jgi:hypothetical protein
MADELPPPIDAEPALKPVLPPPGSPDYKRRAGAKAEGAAEAPAAAAEAPSVAEPVAALLQFAGERHKRVTLSFPFMDNGVQRDVVVINRLTMSHVDRLVREGRHSDLYEIFAEMTGLPAPVLRGMDADDGERMIAEGADFLPRSLREAFGLASG